MAYWEASAIAAELPQAVLGLELVGASTSPVNLGGMASYVSQIGAEFDSTVAAVGYTVPIPTTASSYPFAQLVVGMGVRAIALEEIYGSDARATRLRDSYLDALKRISDGSLILSAPLDTSGSGRVLGRYGVNLGPQIVASLGGIRRGFPNDF